MDIDLSTNRGSELDGLPAKGGAVDWGRAVFSDGLAVGDGGVTGIGEPAVLGVDSGLFCHVGIAVGFCQDAGGCDGRVASIPLDVTAVRNVVGLESVAVDQRVVWSEGQGIQRAVHGEEGGVEDVDFVDFLVGGPADGPSCGRVFDLDAEGPAGAGRQFFRVVECEGKGGCRRDDGCSCDRARQAAAPRFVNAGFEATCDFKV